MIAQVQGYDVMGGDQDTESALAQGLGSRQGKAEGWRDATVARNKAMLQNAPENQRWQVVDTASGGVRAYSAPQLFKHHAAALKASNLGTASTFDATRFNAHARRGAVHLGGVAGSGLHLLAMGPRQPYVRTPVPDYLR
jgi:hypothetical protein